MRKSIVVVAAAATTLVVAGGSVAYATQSKTVTLSVDGHSQKVRTFGSTVADALKAKGITVNDRDAVAPTLDTKLRDGQEIAVNFARPFTVTTDGTTRQFWTTADSVSEALQALGLRYDGAQLSTSRSAPIGRQGLALTVKLPKTVYFIRYGRAVPFRTTALTVAEAVGQANVKVDGNDKVSPAMSAPIRNGSRIVIGKVDIKRVVAARAIPFGTQTTRTDALYEGQKRVARAGVAGKRQVTYLITLLNGKVANVQEIASKTVTAPVTQLVQVGTKPRPASEPAVGDTSVWDRIAECESGGNWSINTGNGYYGGLQFSYSTWHNYGGGVYAEYPHQATKAQQIAIAEKVRDAEGGYGAWPVCGQRA